MDESGVWSYMKGGRKPEGLPVVDPTDEDANLAAAEREKLEKTIGSALKRHPAADEDAVRADAIDAVHATGTGAQEGAILDEDDPTSFRSPRPSMPVPMRPPPSPRSRTGLTSRSRKRRPRRSAVSAAGSRPGA